MTRRQCRCSPTSMCGACDEEDLKRMLAEFEQAEQSPLPNARRDDEDWTERIRRYVEANGGE